MKNQILYFLIGGLCFLCISAGLSTSTEVVNVRFVQPKKVYIDSFHSLGGVRDAIFLKHKEGWILKSYSTHVAGCCLETYSIVMEKY